MLSALLFLFQGTPADLVDRLQHPDIAERVAAADRLEKLGEIALDAVRAGRDHADAEVRARCADLERQLTDAITRKDAAEKVVLRLRLTEEGKSWRCSFRNGLPVPLTMRRSLRVRLNPEPPFDIWGICANWDSHECPSADEFCTLRPGEEIVFMKPAGDLSGVRRAAALYEFDPGVYLQDCRSSHPDSLPSGPWDRAAALRLESAPLEFARSAALTNTRFFAPG